MYVFLSVSFHRSVHRQTLFSYWSVFHWTRTNSHNFSSQKAFTSNQQSKLHSSSSHADTQTFPLDNWQSPNMIFIQVFITILNTKPLLAVITSNKFCVTKAAEKRKSKHAQTIGDGEKWSELILFLVNRRGKLRLNCANNGMFSQCICLSFECTLKGNNLIEELLNKFSDSKKTFLIC